MALGRCVGSACGVLLLGQVMILAALAFLLVPSSSGRQLQKYYEDDYTGGELIWLQYVNFGLLALAYLIAACVSIPIAICYWKMYIEPTHEKFLPYAVTVPQELTGSHKYGICDFGEHCGTCLCFTFCNACAMGDLWYRAGYTHATTQNQVPPIQNCNGWQFFMGCCGFMLLSQWLECCYPCALAALSSGVGWMNQEGSGCSGMGSIVPFRQRFQMPMTSNSFCEDCCLWCWCLPCQATREYRQISDVLQQWPLQVPQQIPSTVVGQPVVVQAQEVKILEPPKPGEVNKETNA